MQADQNTKQTFIISSLAFPKSFSKKAMPSVVPESQIQPEIKRIEKEKESYEKKVSYDGDVKDDDQMGTMELDLEHEAEAMLGVQKGTEVIEETDPEDYEELEEEDILIVAAYNTPEVSSLHCYVYQPSVSNFYLQHDNLVSEHCLCVEWMNFHPYAPQNQQANVVACATFDTFIEIWDMDVRDNSSPVLTLGGDGQDIPLVEDQHQGGILTLSWHQENRHLLASGSEDFTVKVWDLQSATVGISLNHHKNVVHAVSWNPVQSQQLLTSSFDGTACLVDPSAPDKPLSFKYQNGRQAEEISWRDENEFAVSFNTGHVVAYDKRNNSQPLWTFKPHKTECHSLHFHTEKANTLLATCGADQSLFLYDITKFNAQKDMNHDQSQARLYSENKKTALFTVRFHENDVVVGGQNIIELTDLRSLDSVRERYGETFALPEGAGEENDVEMTD